MPGYGICRSIYSTDPSAVWSTASSYPITALHWSESCGCPVMNALWCGARCCMTIFYMTGMRQRIGTDCMAFATLFFANRNALRDFQISEREQEIIRKHMWPLTVIPPMCREAWVVNAVDTASGIVEVLAEYRIFKRLRRRWLESKLELLKQVKENL